MATAGELRCYPEYAAATSGSVVLMRANIAKVGDNLDIMGVDIAPRISLELCSDIAIVNVSDVDLFTDFLERVVVQNKPYD
jgi:hypothetical protein